MMDSLFQNGADVNYDAMDRLDICVDYWGKISLHEAANTDHLDDSTLLT